jgi:hypothetical protein
MREMDVCPSICAVFSFILIACVGVRGHVMTCMYALLLWITNIVGPVWFRTVYNAHYADQWPAEYFELVTGTFENTWLEIEP